MTRKQLSHKKWLLGFTFISCALLILVILFNCLVDGVGLFRFAKGLQYVATSLIDGKMVAGPLGGYDERELQKMVVQNYPSRRDVITVGSSRNMQVRKRFLRGDQDFFNHSMAAASIQDYVSVVSLYANKDSLPKTVLIGIDPWVFNKKNGMPQWWKQLDDSYAKMMVRIYGHATKVNLDRSARYQQLINMDYTMANYKYLRKSKKLRVTDRVDIDDFVREPDGSIHFPYRWRFKQDERAPYPPNAMPIPYLNDFDTLSDLQFLLDFTKYLQKQGVEVVLLLLPFHPVAYKLFNDNPNYRIVITIEDQLRDLAQRNNVKLIGSYDPQNYGLTGRDFFDDTHGHEVVARKVLAEYR